MEKTTRKIDEYTANWYVICTVAKAEEKVKKELEQSGFETYLPLRPVMRVWGSRKKKIMLPIIPQIVFVCLSKNDIEQISTLKGGFLLLQENEQYVTVAIEQMKVFRKAMEQTNKSVKLVNILSPNSGADVKQVLSIEGVGTVLMSVDNDQ